jgi:hypothetical protein
MNQCAYIILKLCFSLQTPEDTCREVFIADGTPQTGNSDAFKGFSFINYEMKV